MAYDYLPCDDWITAGDLTCGDVGDRASAAKAASDVLFLLSGSQFTGECVHTVQPGIGLCWCMEGLVPYQLWGVTDWAHTYRPGVCGGTNRVKLGFEPIVSVQSVVIDGDTIAGSGYTVEDYRWLVRADCEPWPCTDTWTVTFTAGITPPEMGVRAAKALACELLELASGGACSLPANVQSVSRTGVTVQLLADALDGSPTGLGEVDLFLRTYNPHGLTGNAVVAVPGAAPHSRTVTFP